MANLPDNWNLTPERRREIADMIERSLAMRREHIEAMEISELRIGADRMFRFGKQPSKFSEAYDKIAGDAIRFGQGAYVMNFDPAGEDGEATVFDQRIGDRLVIHVEHGDMRSDGPQITLDKSEYTRKEE